MYSQGSSNSLLDGFVLRFRSCGRLDYCQFQEHHDFTEGQNLFDDDLEDYTVVINDEAQFSIWPVAREIPQGWSAAGISGKRQECLAWIEHNWTDMRPASLIRAMGMETPETTGDPSDH